MMFVMAGLAALLEDSGLDSLFDKLVEATYHRAVIFRRRAVRYGAGVGIDTGKLHARGPNVLFAFPDSHILWKPERGIVQ